MESLNDIYRGSFFSRRYRLEWRVPYICSAIADVLQPKSLVDVGCAIGEFVKGFMDMGIDAYGLEGSANCVPYLQIPQDRLILWDLRRPLPKQEAEGAALPFGVKLGLGVVLCLEVAEHIEEEYCDIFLDNLSLLGKKIVMSYATPGQGGHHHVNCQEESYWLEKMYSRGFISNTTTRDRIKQYWQPVAHKKEIRSYHNHLLCFEVPA